MYLNAHLKVLINDVQVYSIVNCETHRDGHQVGAYCDVTMPLNARIEFNGQDTATFSDKLNGYLTAPTRYLFNTGDHIIVKAKYEGYENDLNADSDGYLKVFEGFLYDFYLTTPIKIKCLDYVYWFNQGLFGDTKNLTQVKLNKKGKPIKNKTKSGTGVSYKKVQFKDLLADLLTWVNSDIAEWNDENDGNIQDVELVEPVFDMELENISFINMSPAAVLEWFKREMGLCITFMGNKLYVNVASFTTGTVKLQTDINVLKSELQSTNLTKKRQKNSKGANSVFLRLRVKAYFLRVTGGLKDSFEIGDEGGQLREVWFYNVTPDTSTTLINGKNVPNNYLSMANEALNKFKQARYSGEVETLLYPFYDLFWKVNYTDVRYPDRNGNYVCTLIKQSFNENGFHRHSKLTYLDGN